MDKMTTVKEYILQGIQTGRIKRASEPKTGEAATNTTPSNKDTIHRASGRLFLKDNRKFPPGLKIV